MADLFKHTYAIIYAIIVLFLYGCSVIFESDIEDNVVNLISPSDSIRTVVVTQTFWWDYVENADKYNLQIASPGFDRIEKLALDTNLSTNRFQTTLIPGIYEWRVRAYNSGYATPYSVNILFIDSTLDLSGQEVILKLPTSNSATNDTKVQFQWYTIYNALLYRFEIRKDNWDGELVIAPVDTTANSIAVELDEGNYTWGVKALNDISASSFTTRDIIIDTTSPGRPELTSPESGKIYSGLPIQLIWNRPDEGGSAISDSIFISADSTDFVNEILETHITTSTYYNITFSDEGDYYWRIRSTDAAGNKSQVSIIRKFTIESK